MGRSCLFILVLLGVLIVGLSACGRADEEPVPTLYVLPTWAPTWTPSPSVVPTEPPTMTPSPTETLVPSPTSTRTPRPTSTTTPSSTPTDSNPVVEIRSTVGAYSRSGPGVQYDIVGKVGYRGKFPVLAQAVDQDGDTWYLIVGRDGQNAWVSGIVAAPDTEMEIALAVTVPPTPTANPTFTLTPAVGLEAQLQQVPVLSDISSVPRQIFLEGQKLGNDPHMIAKVGDCNTESMAFLRPLDAGNYDLGKYGYLQDTVTYFNGSFATDSAAGKVGFNIITVQDSTFTDPRVCRRGESSLACEYRRQRPSVAVIMFGANDVLFISPGTYEAYLRQMIEFSIQSGVIPVLMTFTRRPDGLWQRTLELNMITVNLSREYGIPLVNFWRAASHLPGSGIMPDNAHLTQGRAALWFNGDEFLWGHALRSLLTLQMLDKLRREVPMS